MIHNGIHIEGLSKQFGKRTVLNNCSLTIHSGMVFGLVGRNGAGKTTLIRIALGLLQQDAGSVSVLGSPPWFHETRMYQRMGVVLENDGFAPNLTLRENLKMFAAAKAIAWTDVEAYIAEYWNTTFITTELTTNRTKIKYFSRGQKVQCGICRAFLGNPDILILDEPTVALDIDAYDHVCTMIRLARARGAAVLISSHQLSAIEDVCTTVGILHKGELTILNSGNADDSLQEWRIAADNDSRYAAVIRTATGHEPLYRNGGWECKVTSPDVAIPELVRQLVGIDCNIREVTMMQKSLKEHIRKHYEND